jgi:ABC-type transporter Mla MlaB component
VPSFRHAAAAATPDLSTIARYVSCGNDQRESPAMLRIITEQRGPTIRLELHGTIAGEWIDVLHRHWRDLLAAQPGIRVAVELSNVEFIDGAGKALLRHMAETGVEFDGTGLMNRYVIETISGGL